jgi:enoyl-CoA hydratase/carnithine racemase
MEINNWLGPAKAKRIVVLAEKLAAARAVDWGLADESVPDGTAVEAALETVRRAASLPPNGVRLCKAAINAHANALNETASHADMDQFTRTQNSEGCAEGLRAFMEKETPSLPLDSRHEYVRDRWISRCHTRHFKDF